MTADRGSVGAAAPRAPRVLIVLGHPRSDSFCGALAESYARGAREAGVETRRLDLADLRFDLNVITRSPRDQEPEPDIRRAFEDLDWAQHLVFVFPTWWGTMPALLKGFLDRTFLPGFAFEECESGTGYKGLFGGRSAHVVATMDTPWLAHRIIYRSPPLNWLERATLRFCGVAPVRRTVFAGVKASTPELRRRWLAKVYREGARVAAGVPDRAERRWQNAMAWMAALRLQFYPMTWAAYGLGAVSASGSPFHWLAFWVGLVAMATLEAATVFVNDLCDFDSDQLNDQFGPFTGGSRVLVDGRLAGADLRRGIVAALAAFVACGIVLTGVAPLAAVMLPFAAVLALGYSAKPLRLCRRGLGEIAVGVTHGFMPLEFGYLAQGGSPLDPVPWLLGVPLFCSILPAIVLSGIPDRDADLAVGKGTIAVRFGDSGAMRFASVAAGAAILSAAAVWPWSGMAVPVLAIGLAGVVGHGAWLVRSLRASPAPGGTERIDGLMLKSLSFVLWFLAVPLLGR